jgi:hypothetical protein
MEVKRFLLLRCMEIKLHAFLPTALDPLFDDFNPREKFLLYPFYGSYSRCGRCEKVEVNVA